MTTTSGTTAVFFDLIGTLADWTPRGLALRPGAAVWLRSAPGTRLGVIATLPRGSTGRGVLRELEDMGVGGLFEPNLIVLTLDLPVPAGDPRAFAAAAALAGLSPERCVFVSADPTACIAAAVAGMHVVTPAAASAAAAVPTLDSRGATLLADHDAASAPAILLAGEVDEDAGPTYVLRGRVVTMDRRRRVIEGGRVLVRRGLIEAVRGPNEALPEPFENAPVVDTDGTIYPGLIDLHNHFVYNVLPLWTVTERFANRSQWPKRAQYRTDISGPLRALAAYTESSRALLRYVEAKALVGGTTTGQGIRTRVRGTKSLFRGAMRNVEETDDARLPEAGTLVPDLQVREANVASFLSQLERRKAYFYHLSEGVRDSQYSSRRFDDLVDNDLVAPSLVGIHSLGLDADDLAVLAEHGAKIVWSPFSNMLLYGETLVLEDVLEAGVRFSLGCDWAPTGGKNLLEELKVARWVSEQQENVLRDEDLVRAVTVDAAHVVGWEGAVGAIREGLFADLLVLDGADGDPYAQLVDAAEEDVQLVVVHGRPRYGAAALMRAVPRAPGRRLEDAAPAGVEKTFDFHAPGSTINDLSLADATTMLSEAMQDLPGWVERMEEARPQLLASDDRPPELLSLELDNETEEPTGTSPADAVLLVEGPLLRAPVPLDLLHVTGDEEHFTALVQQANVSNGLKEMLRNAY